MPQKYQIEVSVSGVMKSTTMLEALASGGASCPPRPASATPTSIITWLGGVKWQICQRSTGWSSGRPLPRSAICQNGGAMMLFMKRLVITLSPSGFLAGGAPALFLLPPLVGGAVG